MTGRSLLPYYLYTSTSVPIPSLISLEYMGVQLFLKRGMLIGLPLTPVAEKFLRGALVPLNGYHCAKFQLSTSISFGDMEGVPK